MSLWYRHVLHDYTSIEGSKKINKDFVIQTKTHNTNGKDMEMVWKKDKITLPMLRQIGWKES